MSSLPKKPKSLIVDNEAERAKIQRENEEYYARLMEKHKANMTEKQLKAMEEAENGSGNAYGVTSDAVKGHKRRGYQQGKRNKKNI